MPSGAIIGYALASKHFPRPVDSGPHLGTDVVEAIRPPESGIESAAGLWMAHESKKGSLQPRIQPHVRRVRGAPHHVGGGSVHVRHSANRALIKENCPSLPWPGQSSL
jgi:hypothetical protein